MDRLQALQQLLPHQSLKRADELSVRQASWALSELAGQLVQLSWGRQGAAYTLAAELVLQAQQEHQFVAWVRGVTEGVYPVDLYAWGIDPAAMPFVLLDAPLARLQACETLANAAAFRVLVVECSPELSVAAAKRLADAAARHQLTILLLMPPEQTNRQGRQRSQAPGWRLTHLQLISTRQQTADARFFIRLREQDSPMPCHCLEVAGADGLR